MSQKRDSHFQGSDALLPGKGHSPSYGINESTGSSIDSSGKSAPSVIQSIVNPSSGERVWAVAMCSIIACIAAIVNGIVIGYSSPTLSQLSSNVSKLIDPDHYIDPVLEQTTASMFAACSAIGAIFGGPIAWPLSERFGRQATLMLSGLPSVIGWVIIANAHLVQQHTGFVALLLIGRFLTGVAVGWSIFAISVYISEIASAKLRGLFGNCNQLFITIGVFIADLFGVSFNGYIVPYWMVALGVAFLIFVFEVLMLFTYETPRWLFSKGDEFQGIHVLKILRGPNANITKEIDRTRRALRKTYSLKEQFIEFKNRSVYFPFIIALFLMFFQQFSGINAAVFFAAPILKSMDFDSKTANLIALGAVGATQIIATFIAVILVDFLGRRILLLTSGLGMAVGSLMFCGFFIALNRYHVDGHTIGPLGIVGMVLFIASFSLAWGPIPWSMMSELLPNRVRSLAGSIATLVNWTFASIVTVAFQDYQTAITPEFAWLSFAVVMVGSIIFVLLFVPETKGRSLEEIQEHFERGEIFALSCLQRRSKNIHVQSDHNSRLSITSVGGYGAAN